MSKELWRRKALEKALDRKKEEMEIAKKMVQVELIDEMLEHFGKIEDSFLESGRDVVNVGLVLDYLEKKRKGLKLDESTDD